MYYFCMCSKVKLPVVTSVDNVRRRFHFFEDNRMSRLTRPTPPPDHALSVTFIQRIRIYCFEIVTHFYT